MPDLRQVRADTQRPPAAAKMPPKPEKRALIHWVKDNKAGIEPLSHVPVSARFVSSVTPVQFSGDKKWYPAKVVLISDDTDALEKREEELAREIMAKEVADENCRSLSRSRKGKGIKRNVQNVASERQVALALGSKPPVPQHLSEEQKAALKKKKEDKDNHKGAQQSLDGKISDKVRKNLNKTLFEDDTKKASTCGSEEDDDISIVNSKQGKETEYGGNDTDEDSEVGSQSNDETAHEDETATWCACAPCRTLQQYDDPTYLKFLTDMVRLYEHSSASGKKKFLKLKPLPEGVRQVELTTGSGVYISLSAKDQLKVDFKNKPSSLIKEVLFTLFGEQPFKTLNVTARGNKPGSYGIKENILKALLAFVNRHVAADKKVKMSQMVSIINKRTGDWLKAGSPKSSNSVKEKRTPSEKHKKKTEAISTSPFKVQKMGESSSYEPTSPTAMSSSVGQFSPLKTTPMKIIAKRTTPKKTSPLKNPYPQKSPLKKTSPQKSPLKKSTSVSQSSLQPSGLPSSSANTPYPNSSFHMQTQQAYPGYQYGQPYPAYYNNPPMSAYVPPPDQSPSSYGQTWQSQSQSGQWDQYNNWQQAQPQPSYTPL